MKTLDLFQFLIMVEKTHCSHYLILERKGCFVAFLGVPVHYGLLAFFKTRVLSNLEHKEAIVEACRNNGIILSRFESVYSY